jgi:hypothetical protein
MLEAAKELKIMLGIFYWAVLLRICEAGLPKILIKEGNILFNGYWEISILLHIFLHSFPTHILCLVQNDMNPLLKYAFLAPIASIEFLVEMNHRIIAFGVSSCLSVIDQLEYSILYENDSNLFRRYSLRL